MTGTPSPPPQQTDWWRPYVLLGVVVFLLGAVALGASVLDAISVIVFGPVFMGLGVVQIFMAFLFHGGKETWLSLLGAALNIGLGLLLLASPHLGGIEIGLVIAGFLVALGLVRGGRAYVAGTSRGGWLLVAGLAAPAAGCLCLATLAFPRDLVHRRLPRGRSDDLRHDRERVLVDGAGVPGKPC
jgi:uncharacterized membrane protein HdeD (DUF308 family)